MTKTSVKAIVALGLSLGLLLAVGTAMAQKTKGKSRPSTTKYVMAGISQPHCKASSATSSRATVPRAKRPGTRPLAMPRA